MITYFDIECKRLCLIRIFAGNIIQIILFFFDENERIATMLSDTGIHAPKRRLD